MNASRAKLATLLSLRILPALFSALWVANVLHAQVTTTEIRDASARCAKCSIALTRIAMLAPPDSVPDIGPNAMVVTDSRGRFYVSSSDSRHVHRFTADGRFDGEIGRPGQGPGELQGIATLSVGPGDSLFVFDQARLAVFTPNGTYARTARTPGAVGSAVVRADGSLLAKMSIPSPERVGFPVHLIASDGSVYSFGLTQDGRYSANCPHCTARDLHPSPRAGRVWLTARNRYALESWSVDGKLLSAYRVQDSKWFKDWDREANWIDGSSRRPSSILQVAEMVNGDLWVLGAQGSENARPLPPPAGSGITVGGYFAKGPSRAAMQDYVFELMLQNTETVIEYVGMGTREVIASTRVPGEVRLLNAGSLWRTVRRPDDSFGIEVLAVRINP